MPAVRSIADLSGPPRLPLLGNAHQLRTESLHLTIEEWCERYGPIFRFDLGPRRVIAGGDLDEINLILRDGPDGFRRWREMQSVFHEMNISAGFLVAAPDQKSFLAFGAGPRFCPGRNLAFLEAKTAMAMLARNLQIELDETDGPVNERFSFTMVPQGLRVRLRARFKAVHSIG